MKLEKLPTEIFDVWINIYLCKSLPAADEQGTSDV